jgi:hypothetical protein
MTCSDCLKSCPEHSITFCLTCHKHEGECDCGGCTEEGARTFEFSEKGRVYERRSFCEHHATSPYWAIIRKGGVEITA